jgi:Zn-dependent protease
MIIIAWILAFVIAITVHEAAHAWMADRLGDPTAKLMGRLSLNPLVHYDRVGTTMLLVLTILRAIGIPVIPFGWAKPVQYDPFNLQNPRRDSAIISLAGPASNIIVAVLLSLVLRFTQNPFSLTSGYAYLLYPIIGLNIALAIFNLIPLHPLDGGKILVGLLPRSDAHDADIFLRRYSMILLLFMILPFAGGRSVLGSVVSPIIETVLNFLIPNNPLI